MPGSLLAICGMSELISQRCHLTKSLTSGASMALSTVPIHGTSGNSYLRSPVYPNLNKNPPLWRDGPSLMIGPMS
jgi:hypothetical protein